MSKAPAPALTLMPLVLIWGTKIKQFLACQFFGALNVVLVWTLLKRLEIPLKVRLFSTILFGLGTAHFYSAVVGTTWYFAHIIAIFFLLLALIETFGKKRVLLVGTLLGLAALSRETTILSTPFFLWALFKNKKKVLQNPYPSILFLLGLSLPLLFQLYYNFARFGNPLESGYIYVYRDYIRGVPYSIYRSWVPEDFPHFGMFDLRNIPLHLYTLFILPPKPVSHFPFLEFSPYGLSLFFTTPILFYTFKADRKEPFVRAAWLAVVLIAIPILLHFTQGWVQFGYRFLLDFMPFLMMLLAKGLKGKLTKFRIFLLIFSIVINTLGVFYKP